MAPMERSVHTFFRSWKSPSSESSRYGVFWGAASSHGSSVNENDHRTGSSIATFCVTKDEDGPWMLQSMSAMPVYQDKSHEELRHEDYNINNKGKSNLTVPFGTPVNTFSFPPSSVPSSTNSLFAPPDTNPLAPQLQGFVIPTSTTATIPKSMSSVPSNFHPSETFFQHLAPQWNEPPEQQCYAPFSNSSTANSLFAPLAPQPQGFVFPTSTTTTIPDGTFSAASTHPSETFIQQIERQSPRTQQSYTPFSIPSGNSLFISPDSNPLATTKIPDCTFSATSTFCPSETFNQQPALYDEQRLQDQLHLQQLRQKQQLLQQEIDLLANKFQLTHLYTSPTVSPSMGFASETVQGPRTTALHASQARLVSTTNPSQPQVSWSNTFKGIQSEPIERFQSISAFPICEDITHEEFRWMGYQLNNKGKPGSLEPFSRPANMFTDSLLSNPFTATSVFDPLISNLFVSSSTNNSLFPTDPPSNLSGPPLQGFASQGFASYSVPAQVANLYVGPFPAFTEPTLSNHFQFSDTSTTITASVPSLNLRAPGLNASEAEQVTTTTNPSQQPHGEASEQKPPHASFQVNVNSIEADDVSLLMPKLPNGDYYLEPSIEELEARETSEPGYCGHVKDFVVGRRDTGSVKFLGEVDIRELDLESIVKFNEGEVIVYLDDKKKPPIGQGLNVPAEVTLLNVKCISKVTGKQYTDGPHVQRFEKKLVDKAAEIGAEFVSYDPHQGEWKFQVQHF